MQLEVYINNLSESLTVDSEFILYLFCLTSGSLTNALEKQVTRLTYFLLYLFDFRKLNERTRDTSYEIDDLLPGVSYQFTVQLILDPQRRSALSEPVVDATRDPGNEFCLFFPTLVRRRDWDTSKLRSKTSCLVTNSLNLCYIS